MAGNYGYRCSFCGYTSIADDKKKVHKDKAEHNRKVKNPLYPHYGSEFVRADCPMEPTTKDKKVMARPDLAKHLRKERGL